MTSKSSLNSNEPRDLAVMRSILKDMGVEDYEPGVLHQMMEFTYRYVTGVLDDARIYSDHAGKDEIDLSDVKLATQIRLEHCYTTPPSREFLMELAREKNATPMPLINERYGLRLPPDRFCLTATNVQLKKTNKDKNGMEKDLHTTSIWSEKMNLESMPQSLDAISPGSSPLLTPIATPSTPAQAERPTSSQAHPNSSGVPQVISTSVQESMRALKRKHEQNDDEYDSDNYD